MTEYRIENKYIVYEDDIAFIKSRLAGLMQPDAHNMEGTYLVRSLYFDDMDDSAYFQNEAGVDNRSKIRLRSYDNDDSYMILEEKIKKSGFTKKDSTKIDRETAENLVKCRDLYASLRASVAIKNKEDFLFKKLYCNMNTMLVHPTVIVEYERYAFIERAGNVRITFDMNIGAGGRTDRFFEENILAIPVMEQGAHIMEIKYDELLPDHIKKAIDLGRLKKLSFSKYYYARNALSAYAGSLL
ncbi:MAG: polyphosphate polymerase domain-containing protein [Lachnospiraceae bacterium]|nr:polyphosphate polymerase domain-containing protein [Lachnospiraceae bacterium]